MSHPNDCSYDPPYPGAPPFNNTVANPRSPPLIDAQSGLPYGQHDTFSQPVAGPADPHTSPPGIRPQHPQLTGTQSGLSFGTQGTFSQPPVGPADPQTYPFGSDFTGNTPQAAYQNPIAASGTTSNQYNPNNVDYYQPLHPQQLGSWNGLGGENVHPSHHLHDRTAQNPGHTARTDFRQDPAQRRANRRSRAVVPPRRDEYFKVGRFFECIRSETAGPIRPSSGRTTFTMGSEDMPVYQGWRRFIVVREGHDSCQCVPIHTYQGRGATKPGVNPNTHAAVHLRGQECFQLQQEHLTLLPIEVEPANHAVHLLRMSRINFDKIHTVEHNASINHLGEVKGRSLIRLKDSFRLIFIEEEDSSWTDTRQFAYPS